MTWLDIGNGWRNLFLLSCLVQMGALGCLFAARGWFAKSRLACFLTGVAVTPIAQYGWMLLWAFVWPHAPKLFLIGGPPALAGIGLGVMGILRVRKWRTCLASLKLWLRRMTRFDKPALVALCFAICLVLLIGPACVRFMSSMNCVSGGDAGEYMALAQRWCEDRSLAELLEKEETVGHFRGHSHFPSLELYMSYGLLHTGGEVGYPNDKAAFTGIGMLIFYAAAAYAALLLIFCKEKKLCVLLGLLMLNLVPGGLYDSVAAAPRDIWRILALLFAALAFAGLTEKGGVKTYLGKLLWVYGLCFAVMSAHVVCFVVLPFIVAAWVIWRFAHAGLTEGRGAWIALMRSIGLALSGAAGTLCAFAGNLWCYFKWGEMSPWRLMTTFTDAPWYSMYMDMEYKLEETTTHLDFLRDRSAILLTYVTRIGDAALFLSLIALAAAVVYLVVTRRAMRKGASEAVGDAAVDGLTVSVRNPSPWAERVSLILLTALITLLTLAPMSGLIDSKLYSFSGAFVKLTRYTLQWFFFGNVTVCACIALFIDLWPQLWKKPVPDWVKRLPVWGCAVLCAAVMAKGTNQTGYTDTFYRASRNVMESDRILLDNDFTDRYGLLRAVAAEADEDSKILITRVGYQYAIRAKGYVLTANPIVHLMNLPLEEVEGELKAMNVCMLATEPSFWDDRYYALSTLSTYLNALPQAQIVETDNMRLYLLDPGLVPAAEAYVKEGLE